MNAKFGRWRTKRRKVERATPRTIRAADLSPSLRVLLDEISRNGSRIVIESDGQPVALLVPLPEFTIRTKDQAVVPPGFEPLFSTQSRFADVPDDEIEPEIVRAIAAVRAEYPLST